MNNMQIGQVTKVATTTIIPVEQLIVYRDTNSTTSWWYGSKELYALVISTSTGFKAFDMHSNEMSIGDLIREVPTLNEYLYSNETSE